MGCLAAALVKIFKAEVSSSPRSLPDCTSIKYSGSLAGVLKAVGVAQGDVGELVFGPVLVHGQREGHGHGALVRSKTARLAKRRTNACCVAGCGGHFVHVRRPMGEQSVASSGWNHAQAILGIPQTG
jgi:hypothetical protein